MNGVHRRMIRRQYRQEDSFRDQPHTMFSSQPALNTAVLVHPGRQGKLEHDQLTSRIRIADTGQQDVQIV